MKTNIFSLPPSMRTPRPAGEKSASAAFSLYPIHQKIILELLAKYPDEFVSTRGKNASAVVQAGLEALARERNLDLE